MGKKWNEKLGVRNFNNRKFSKKKNMAIEKKKEKLRDDAKNKNKKTKKTKTKYKTKGNLCG